MISLVALLIYLLFIFAWCLGRFSTSLTSKYSIRCCFPKLKLSTMTFVSQAFRLRREEDVRKGELGSQSSYIKNESDQKSHRHIMVSRWKMTRPWTHYSWSRSCAWANKETVKGDNMIVNITSLLKLTFLVYLAFLRGLQKATLCCCCFFLHRCSFHSVYPEKET